MQISLTGTLNSGTSRDGPALIHENNNKHESGFTLIELVIVILLISVTTALIMPNLWDSGERALKSEAKRIGNTLRYVHDEALGKKRMYLVKFNFDSNSWGFESEGESRTFQMNERVILKDIVLSSIGEISFGEATVKFGPLGSEEPITLHLIHKEAEYTVRFNHISGRVKLYEGYIL